MNNNKKIELVRDLVLLALVETDANISVFIGEIESIEDYVNQGKVLPAFFHYFINEDINFSMNHLIITNLIEVAAGTLNEQLTDTEINQIATEVFNRHVHVITETMKDIGI